MAVFHENMLIGSSGQGTSGYQVSRSLRFNSADSARLARTFGTPTTQATFTLSLWCKRTSLSSEQRLLGTVSSFFRFTATDTLQLTLSGGSLASTAVFRDTSSWYHIVWSASGTTQTIYVNNTQVISGTLSNNAINSAISHQLGAGNTASFFNGYLTEVYFVDGQALTPSSFAETDAITDQWIPKSYGGTYGNNGFKLTFSDNSDTTSTTLGKDSAGSNDWTPTGFSVAAGVGNDSLVDTPTMYGSDTGIGGEVRGNYCVLNTLNNPGGSTISNGGLQVLTSSTSQGRVVGTFGMSTGKWYWEVPVITDGGSRLYIGLANASSNTSAFPQDGSEISYESSGNISRNGGSTTYGASYTAGDTISIALDLDAGNIVFYKNGTSQGTANTVSLVGTFVAAIADGNNASAWTVYANFGQRAFTYTAPAGYKTLCSANLAEPLIVKSSTAFDTVIYTGTGATLTPTSTLAFSPDFVWIKSRSAATDNALYDIVRGATFDLVSNSSAAQTTQTQGLTAFNANGFTVGTLAKLNTNAATYAGWCWDAGSSTVTNTSGSISSQVRANASTGFSVVTYTTITGSGTIGHGLGVAPDMIILKSGNQVWPVYHTSIAGSYVQLNATSASASSTGIFGSVSSTTFSIGTSSIVKGGDSVAYCFDAVSGYSAFNSYTGNGIASGPFVYLGFRPAFILIKCTSTTGNWVMLDDKREGYNVDNDPLYSNLANAEGTDDLLDITSTGFKIQSTAADVNTSAATYIYAAFAEVPFKYGRAR
jgi:hypothetical protein